MAALRTSKEKSGSPAAQLLAWYDVHRRSLPWRASSGRKQAPYRVWLSEIMLQQTTVAAVAGYYREFLRRWPNVEALARAPLDDVLAAWAGLGYYARARNLHKAARVVAEELGGRFPESADALKALPGVGTYTAGAIAAIAFDARVAAVDANAERVLARLFAVETPLPAAKPELRRLGQSLMPDRRAGDFVQALMDLGAGVCTPKRPSCGNCPWSDDCAGRRRRLAETLPRKAPLRPRPLRRGAAFVAQDSTGAVLLVKRPEKGLLGGMLEPPLGPWTESFPSSGEALLQAPFRAKWTKRAGVVRHGFTHFELEIEVYAAELTKQWAPIFHPPLEGGSKFAASDSEKKISGRGNGGEIHPSPNFSAAARRKNSASPAKGEATIGPQSVLWLPVDRLKDAALPTVMRKIIAHGLDEGGPQSARSGRHAAAGARRRSI